MVLKQRFRYFLVVLIMLFIGFLCFSYGFEKLFDVFFGSVLPSRRSARSFSAAKALCCYVGALGQLSKSLATG